MIITLQRKTSTDKSTSGRLIVGDLEVFTLEDPQQEHKIWGETRIPAGTYKLQLRTAGGMHQRYKRRFPDMHQGMIWLLRVPLFEWVYIHIGNTPEDTHGCILVGRSQEEDRIYNSTDAYKLIYPEVVKAIRSDDGCKFEIKEP